MGDDQPSIDDALTEDALAALAGRECEHGGGILDPRTGQCEDESHTHCQWFCGDAYCGHQFISWNDNDGYDGPKVPLPPTWLGPVSEWSDESKEAAFGDIPQLGTYYEEIEDGDLPDLAAFEIAVLVAEQLAVQVHAEQWEQTMSLASGCGTVVYAKDPGRAKAELVTRFEELKQGFARVAGAAAGVDDIQAEQALAALAELKCPNCGSELEMPRPWFCDGCSSGVCLTCRALSNTDSCSHLLPTEGKPGWDHRACVACGEPLESWKCTNCLSVHCPFCGVRSHAWRGSDWTLGQTTCSHLIASWCDSSGEWQMMPVRDEDIGFDRLNEIAVVDRDEAAVRAAFGDLIDLARVVEDSLTNRHPTGALDALIESAGLASIEDIWWDDQNGMGSDTGDDYFAADSAALTVLHWLIDQLVTCQKLLNAAVEGEAP
ncbi:MAG: hypothetical protein IT305_15410 [Chloroflexi bacterium]|nr:hypothetical protein [Chloroflexota bacterium]